MDRRTPSDHLSREDLFELVGARQRQVAQLSAQVAQLQTENDALKRQTYRQAAPVSTGQRVSKPKRPGRKPGSGTFCSRQPPALASLRRPPVEVPVTETACPGCGGDLEHEQTDWADKTDLAPLPAPRVTAYQVAVCRCRVCGQHVRGPHPAVAPDQDGAPAHRVGDRVMALAHVLPYGLGLPVRKTPKVLALLGGIRITQSAMTQDALRRTRGEMGEGYEQWRASVAARPVVHTADTGWRVGGAPASLMACETEEETVYQVRAASPRRSGRGDPPRVRRGDGNRSRSQL